MPKWSILAIFRKPEACGQTVLPDMSLLIGQKLMKNAKIQILSTENVNVARFARNVEFDFLAIFKHCEQAEVLKLGDFSRVHFRIPEGLPFKKQFYEAFSAGLTNVKSTLEFHSKEEEERSESKWKKSNFCFHFWLQNCRILKKRNIHSV